MKIAIKKICLFLALIISPSFCFGAETYNINIGEDYIITTETPASANAIDNPEILSLKTFFTIFNEKNIFLIHPEKVGKTKLTLFFKTGDVVFNINVKPKTTPSTFNTVIKNGVEFNLLDQPPIFEQVEIEAPPTKTKVSP